MMRRYLNKTNILCLLRGMLICGVVFLQWLQLEYSPIVQKTWDFAQSEMLILMNLGLVSFVDLVLVLFLQKWEIGRAHV